MLFYIALVLLVVLAVIAFWVKSRREAPPVELEPEGTRIAEVFTKEAKQEEMRLEDIRDRVEEARADASQGSPGKARETLNKGWSKARGEQ